MITRMSSATRADLDRLLYDVRAFGSAVDVYVIARDDKSGWSARHIARIEQEHDARDSRAIPLYSVAMVRPTRSMAPIYLNGAQLDEVLDSLAYAYGADLIPKIDDGQDMEVTL